MTNKICLILSSPRSGSTVLRNKLDLIPNVVALPSDIRLFQFVDDNLNADRKEISRKFYEHLRKIGKLKFLDQIEERLLSLHPMDMRAFVFGLFSLWGDVCNKQIDDQTIFIEKSPNSLYYLKTAKKMFPDAILFHLIRDPRSVVAGLNQRPWSGHNTLTNAKRWVREQKIMMHESGFTIAYEDLVSNPADSLERILRFFGRYSAPTLEEILRFDLSSSNQNVAQPGRKLHSGNLGKYKSTLSTIDRDIEIVEYTCSKMMSYYKYEKTAKNFDMIFYKSYFFKALEHWFNEILRFLKRAKEY